MLLGCQLFFLVNGAHGEKNSQSHVCRQLVSSTFSVALFQNLMVCERSSILAAFGEDLSAVAQTPPSPVSTVPDLLLVQLLFLSSKIKKCCNS